MQNIKEDEKDFFVLKNLNPIKYKLISKMNKQGLVRDDLGRVMLNPNLFLNFYPAEILTVTCLLDLNELDDLRVKLELWLRQPD